MTKSSGKYLHRPLDKITADIRIARLMPGKKDEPIACQIEHMDLSTDTNFEAVSYCWGDASITKPITLEGHLYPVTLNLHSCLQHLRREDEPRNLWIDSICINQSDNTEKSREVGRMRDIYARAKQVLVWVGDYEPYTKADVQEVFSYAQALSEDYDYSQDGAIIARIGYKQLWRLRRKLQHFIGGHDWFTRMWIIQEVSTRPLYHIRRANEMPQIICGDLQMSFCHLQRTLAWWTGVPREHTHLRLPFGGSNVDVLLQIWVKHKGHLRRWTEEESAIIQIIDIMCQVAGRFQATDNRDMIYAVLGLVCDAPIPLCVKPDYSKNAEEVLLEVARFMLESTGLIDIIQFRSGRTSTLPSWVPDWTYQGNCPILHEKMLIPDIHFRICPQNYLEVDLLELTHINQVSATTLYHITSPDPVGLLHRYIEHMSEALEIPNCRENRSVAHQRLLDLILAYDMRIRHIANNTAWYLYAASTIINHHQGASRNEFHCGGWANDKELPSNLSPDEIHSALENISEAVVESLDRKHGFTCLDGAVGIVSQPGVMPQKGDIICTIRGSVSEYICRRSQSSETYRIIGQCERDIRGYDFALWQVGISTWADWGALDHCLKCTWKNNTCYRALIS